MARLLSLAAITATVSLGLLFAACSGSSGVTIPDGTSKTDSGGTTSGGLGGDSGPTNDSGKQCAPCETENPDPSSCTTTDPCQCGPFTCTDSGTADTCEWGAANTCGAGKYCLAPGCGKGTCVAIGTGESTANNPRCGCDGVTYWNPTVAASHGMSLAKGNGACNSTAVACGAANPACPAGASCNLEKDKLEDCIDGKSGTCWVLPSMCPPSLPAVKDAKSCGATSCIGECAAIKTGAAWYSGTCGGF